MGHYDKERAIAAQNAGTTAATIFVGIGTRDWDADLYDEIRRHVFNGTLELAGAEMVVEAFESVADEAPARSVPSRSGGTRSGGSSTGSTEIRSGKHAGKTIAAVYDEDPSYIEWGAGALKNDFLKRAFQRYLDEVA